jgi:hypothetical protein
VPHYAIRVSQRKIIKVESILHKATKQDREDYIRSLTYPEARVRYKPNNPFKKRKRMPYLVTLKQGKSQIGPPKDTSDNKKPQNCI